MTQGRVRHLPVIDDGKVVGMISIGDVVKQRLDDAELEVESLAATSRCSPVSTGDTDPPMWLVHLKHPVQARDGSICAKTHRPHPPWLRRECGDLSALHRA